MQFTQRVEDFPVQQRHHHIFRAYDALAVGDALVLEARHDPSPFMEQFRRLRQAGGRVDWVQEGPPLWRFILVKDAEDPHREMPMM